MRTDRLAPVVLVLAILLAGCGGSSTPRAPAPSATAGGTAWVERYGGSGEAPDVAQSVVVSPDGRRVFVTGSSATIAYRADSGRQQWLVGESAFRRSGGSTPAPTAAMSPDGTTVVVAGTSSEQAFRTQAYDANNGRLRWAEEYRGPAGGDSVRSVAVSASTVFVFGISASTDSGSDFATVAYDVTTGVQLWVARYDGPGRGDELHFPVPAPQSLALSEDGATVLVTGGSKGRANADYATVAYSASTGAQQWVARYNGPADGDDISAAVAVRGGKVLVTGASNGASAADFATVAYDVRGRQLWVSRYDGPAGRNDGAGSIAVTPNGQRVFVTGTSEGATPEHEDFATVAYDGAGRQQWATRYDGPAGNDDNATAIAFSRDGTTVWVTGRSKGPSGADYATVGYDAWTGAQTWTARYDGPAHGDDEPSALAVNPATSALYVTGSSNADQGPDYATVAYRR